MLDDYDSGFSSTDGLSVGGGIGAKSYGEDHAGFSGAAPNGPGGGNSASWTFSGLTPGIYQVSAAWVAHTDRSTGVEYAIRTGEAVLSTVSVNQEDPPIGDAVESDGIKNVNFQHLGSSLLVTEDALTVEVFNRIDQDKVNVDAIRLELIVAVPNSAVADDRDAATEFTSFTTQGTWVDGNGSMTYGGDRLNADGGNGSNVATWNFENLLPGVYQISTTWKPHGNRNIAAAYDIGTGAGVSHTRYVNQQSPPQADIVVGSSSTSFQHLGSAVVVSGDNLFVSLSDLGTGKVVADAVHIERVSDLPTTVIADDRDAATDYASFVTTGAWGDSVNSAESYAGDRLNAYGGLGLNTATWTFGNLRPGVYRISTTWQKHPTNRNTSAPYSIYADGELVAVRKVNQQVTPQADATEGPQNTPFQDLHESVILLGNALSVTLADVGPGKVIADAVRIERIGDLSDVPSKPEAVRAHGPTGGDYDIPSGEDQFDARARQRIVFSPATAGVAGFEIWRSLSGVGTPDTDENWEQVETLRSIEGLSPTAIARWAADVAAQRPFYYRVRAYNASGFSAWSDLDRIDFVTHEEVNLMVSATVDDNPSAPSITLQFPHNVDSDDETYAIYRKGANDATWTLLADNSSGQTLGISSWTDTTVSVGEVYEYRVDRFLTLPSGATSLGRGYVLSGIEAPLTENRGTVLLVVEATHADNLDVELARLERDLIGDGWRVARTNVTSTMAPPEVKQRILAASAAYSDLNSVLLIGNVAVPRSGTANPDTHRSRALPADAYYGDLDGIWTDTSEDYTTGVYSYLFSNTPGDGKFDQSGNLDGLYLPELAVGRVDMSEMASFGSEVNLLRQYLNKDHLFRTGEMEVQRRGFVDDHMFANLNLNNSGESKVKWAWRDFAAMFGLDGVDQDNSRFGDSLSANSYLWVDAASEGAGDIGNPAGLRAGPQLDDYLNQSILGVFNSFVSSYSVEYERPDAFLNAPLADEGYGLVSFWTRYGDPHFHRMALGGTIGEGLQLSRQASEFGFSQGMTEAYTNLLGDPTLRLHSVAPPSNLQAAAAVGGGAQLTWTLSGDANVAEYYVYKRDAVSGRFVRIGAPPITSGSFVDPTGDASTDVYMVRAAKLEQSGSGTYWNASQGIFSDDSAVRGELLQVVTSGVDTATPTSDVTLRYAVLTANAWTGKSVIVLPEGQYELSVTGTDDASAVGDLDINGDVRLLGDGAGLTVINAATASDRAFQVHGSGILQLERLTVTGGSTGGNGGAVDIQPGASLIASYVSFVENYATGSGGGIHNNGGSLDLQFSVLTKNGAANGGAISVTGAASHSTIGTTVFANNSASASGANVLFSSGTTNNLGQNLIDDNAGAGGFFSTGLGDTIGGSIDFVVTTIADTNRTSPDDVTLSLREAVMLSNLITSAQIIWLPAWSFELSIERSISSPSDVDAAYGDLDVARSLTARGIAGHTSVHWEEGLSDEVFDLLGDYDDDNDVDLTDFSLWKNVHDVQGYDQSVDGDEDGDVDLDDFQLVSDNFYESLSLYGIDI